MPGAVMLGGTPGPAHPGEHSGYLRRIAATISTARPLVTFRPS
jgi:hypothetical protein